MKSDFDRRSEFRYRATLAITMIFGSTLFFGFFIGLNILLSGPMRDRLRLAYPSSQISIISLKIAGGFASCGYYRAGGEATQWRYLNADEGLWAEGLSKAWRNPDEYPLASAKLSKRWENCMSYVHHGRGGGLDFIMLPLTVIVLNMT